MCQRAANATASDYHTMLAKNSFIPLDVSPIRSQLPGDSFDTPTRNVGEVPDSESITTSRKHDAAVQDPLFTQSVASLMGTTTMSQKLSHSNCFDSPQKCQIPLDHKNIKYDARETPPLSLEKSKIDVLEWKNQQLDKVTENLSEMNIVTTLPKKVSNVELGSGISPWYAPSHDTPLALYHQMSDSEHIAKCSTPLKVNNQESAPQDKADFTTPDTDESDLSKKGLRNGHEVQKLLRTNPSKLIL
jgi:hypothetical protein